MWLISAIAFVIIAITCFIKFHPQFGGTMLTSHKKRYAQSKHWNGKQFENLSHTTMNLTLGTFPKLLYQQFTDTSIRKPEKPIPILPFNATLFNSELSRPKFIWYGHAVLLLQLDGKNILIDPMFGPDTTPIAPIANKRFSENTLAIIDELPPIDAVLITHDHYDHIDYASIQKLKWKIDTYFVSLGVARHLESWGISSDKITEFDWWQAIDFHGITITFTPSRHFSGRGLFDRAKVLWGGWVFQTSDHQIYWSGDGGYDEHFKIIGDKFGTFDWVFVECGQYNEAWKLLHLFPEECVQAGFDANATICIPYHWGGFALAMHPWKEPIERFVKEAAKRKLPISTPGIGEIVVMGEEPAKDWWTALK